MPSVGAVCGVVCVRCLLRVTVVVVAVVVVVVGVVVVCLCVCVRMYDCL